MDRELVLVIVILVTGGIGAVAVGLVPSPRRSDDVVRSERALWRAITRPLAAIGLVVATIIGWALQEPRHAEVLRSPLLLLAALVAFVWVRAAVRAGFSLRTPADEPAMTIGLLHPRIVVSTEFAAAIDRDVLAAVIAHEAAHARHRDPLRIFIAQLATDLQWPSRQAHTRLDDWTSALEMARDDEARSSGADGADLAAGIVAAARIKQTTSGAVARLTGAQLVVRIERLLRPLSHHGAGSPSRTTGIIWLVALGAAVAFGALCGESIVSALS